MIRTSFSLESGSKINLRLEFTRRLMMRMLIRAQKSLTSWMHTNFQVFLNLNWLIQQDFSKELWNAQSKKELHTECNIFQSKRCSLHKNWWTWRMHSKQLPWVAQWEVHSLTFNLYKLCSQRCKSSQQKSSLWAFSWLAARRMRRISFHLSYLQDQLLSCLRKTQTRFQPAPNKNNAKCNNTWKKISARVN